MPRFFIDGPVTDTFKITGDDAYHIMKSLRMKIGEPVTLCHDKMDYSCIISGFCRDSVEVKCLNCAPCVSEPKLNVTLYQGFPKGDKMDFIVQKSVEIGVCTIVPMITQRCIARPDQNSFKKKIDRLQKIALEAAKQSGRGIVPQIKYPMSFDDAVNSVKCSTKNKSILFYEKGGISLHELMKEEFESVSIFIGPEGGFEESEVEIFLKTGGSVCSLGPRILRTETAALVSSSFLLFFTEEK